MGTWGATAWFGHFNEQRLKSTWHVFEGEYSSAWVCTSFSLFILQMNGKFSGCDSCFHIISAPMAWWTTKSASQWRPKSISCHSDNSLNDFKRVWMTYPIDFHWYQGEFTTFSNKNDIIQIFWTEVTVIIFVVLPRFSLIQRINIRKRRDSFIIGLVIAICTFLLILYAFNWAFGSNKSIIFVFVTQRWFQFIIKLPVMYMGYVLHSYWKKKYEKCILCGREEAIVYTFIASNKIYHSLLIKNRIFAYYLSWNHCHKSYWRHWSWCLMPTVVLMIN